MSMLGVAYEVAAILSEDMKLPEINLYRHQLKKPQMYLNLRVEERKKSNVRSKSCEKY